MKTTRRGVGVAYRAGFENQCARKSTAGSNPALSVRFSRTLQALFPKEFVAFSRFLTPPVPSICPHSGESGDFPALDMAPLFLPVPVAI